MNRFEAGLHNLAILSAAAAQQEGNEFSAKAAVASVESVIQKYLLPLLEAADRCLNTSGHADAFDARADLRKELDQWLTG